MTADFRIVCDTREQKPYSFDEFGVESVRATLTTGDYAPQGYEDHCAVECKSPSDFQGVLTRDRARFEKELTRLDAMACGNVVVECDLLDMLTIHRGGMSPQSCIATIIAWRQRYRIDFWFVPGRSFAQKLTFKICERSVRDIASGKRGDPAVAMEPVEVPA